MALDLHIARRCQLLGAEPAQNQKGSRAGRASLACVPMTSTENWVPCAVCGGLVKQNYGNVIRIHRTALGQFCPMSGKPDNQTVK